MSIASEWSETWKCDHCGFEETWVMDMAGVDWIKVVVVVEDPLNTRPKPGRQVCSWECAAAIAQRERTRPEGWDERIPGALWDKVLSYRDSRQTDVAKSGSTSIRQ